MQSQWLIRHSRESGNPGTPGSKRLPPVQARGRLVWGFDCQVAFLLGQSVAAVAAWGLDRLKLLEVEFGDSLQLVGQSRSFEVVRDVVEPGAVFVLQSDQRRHRCRPAHGPWREALRRGRGWEVALLAQRGADPDHDAAMRIGGEVPGGGPIL